MLRFIPPNVNQCFFIIIFENGNFMLFDNEMNSQKVMALEKNRSAIELMLKNIEKYKNKSLTPPSLQVYELVDNKLKLLKIHPFYNFLARYEE